VGPSTGASECCLKASSAVGSSELVSLIQSVVHLLLHDVDREGQARMPDGYRCSAGLISRLAPGPATTRLGSRPWCWGLPLWRGSGVVRCLAEQGGPSASRQHRGLGMWDVRDPRGSSREPSFACPQVHWPSQMSAIYSARRHNALDNARKNKRDSTL
jgi:hypothetical protein